MGAALSVKGASRMGYNILCAMVGDCGWHLCQLQMSVYNVMVFNYFLQKNEKCVPLQGYGEIKEIYIQSKDALL